VNHRKSNPFRPGPLTAAMALALSAGPVLAQPADTTEPTKPRSESSLARILVTAAPEQTSEIAGSVHVIDAEELEKHAYSDVNRILRQVPGMNIVEEEGFGNRPNIGIRGSGTDRNSKITVMEDGVLIAPAPYAAPAAYYFPRMSRINGVEVTKGPATIKYGPLTTGGAINLSSTPIPEPTDGGFGGRLRLSAGEFDTTRGHVVVGGYIPTGKAFDVGVMLETVQEKSTGFKKLDSGGDTGFDFEDYVVKLALRSTEGAKYKQALELKLQYSDEVSDETYLGLSLEDFHANPFRRYRASQVDELVVDHTTYQVSHTIDFGNRVDLTTMVYATETNRNWSKLESVRNGGSFVGISSVVADPTSFASAFEILRGADSAPGDLRVRANNRAYDAYGIQSVLGVGFDTGAATHQLEASLRFHKDEEDRFQHEDSFQMINGTMVLTAQGAPGSQANRIGEAEAWALFVRDTIDWGNWTLVPGVRYENIDLKRTDFAGSDPNRTAPTRVSKNTVDVWIPGFGAIHHLHDHWQLVAGVHRGFSSPSPGSSADPERSWNYEAGVRFARQDTRIEAIGFFNDFSNLVGTCTESSGGGCTIGDQFEAGKARVYGLELVAAHDAGRQLGLGLSVPLTATYTFMKGEFRESFNSDFAEFGNVTTGDELPFMPEHQVTLSAGLEGNNWRTTLTMNYLDEARARAGSGTIPAGQRIDSRTLFDIAGEYDLTQNTSLFASVQNLTDKVYNASFRPAGARPGLPRTIMAGIKVDF
jgi:Fe(3+) dicitrate transport protein